MTSAQRELVTTGVIVALLTFLGGCASDWEAYRPVEPGPQRGPRAPVSYYRIVVANEDLGSVKLWSPGGHQKRKDGEPAILDVELRVQNHSDAPMTLDLERSDLQLYLDDATTVTVDQPVGDERQVVVEPGGVKHFLVSYSLPRDVELGKVDGFDFDWTLETSKGLYSEATAFEQDQGPVGRSAFWPVYDPWWWGWAAPYPFGYRPYIGFGVDLRYWPRYRHRRHRHR